MRLVLVGWVIIACALAACENRPAASPGKSEEPQVPKVVVEREKINRDRPLPPDVKIRLKRDGKGSYSWELSGSDAEEILKVNEKLRKKVEGEQTK